MESKKNHNEIIFECDNYSNLIFPPIVGSGILLLIRIASEEIGFEFQLSYSIVISALATVFLILRMTARIEITLNEVRLFRVLWFLGPKIKTEKGKPYYVKVFVSHHSTTFTIGVLKPDDITKEIIFGSMIRGEKLKKKLEQLENNGIEVEYLTPV